MSKNVVLCALALLALAACGGGSVVPTGSSTGTGTGTGSGSGSGGGVVNASAITVTTSSATIPADGSATATITALVRDTSNNLISGVPVVFTASSGGLAVTSAVTDSSGAATAILSTAGDASLRTITVTATGGSLSNTATIQVVAATGSTSVQMGTGTGAGFQPGIIGISNANVSAGGSTSLTVSVANTGSGTLYTQPVTVTFNSPCVAAGSAALQPAATASTSTGIATVTYVATGCSGSDVVTATATVGAQSLSATGTVTVAAASIGSIVFQSATPTNIALRGTGDASRPESSVVVFKVRDASNGPVPNAPVTFSLNTSVGGIALTSASATSDSQGLVQTVVNAGTVATSVKVTATVTSIVPAITTQSSQLTITTGIPTQASFSLAVGCFSIEGWDYDGTTTTVTARLGDRFQNPVPDGTAVTYTAEGGNIQSQCTTQTTATEGGLCAVNFRSSNPRPTDGRVTVFAKAIGEESFVDANGNGAFDNGETFTDLPERYRDDNEDGSYQSGEEFFDFNNNGTRDAADGYFNGVLCNDTTGRCGPASSRSTGIAAQNIVILSGSGPTVSLLDGSAIPASFAIGAVNSSRGITFWIRDLHGNPMPGGTVVSLSVSGGALGVGAPSSFSIPCSAISAGVKASGITVFAFALTSGTSPGSGVATLTVTTPKSLTTIFQFDVTAP